MIQKRTLVDQIEVTRGGIIQVRLALVLEEDGKEMSKNWHRFVVEPGYDAEKFIGIVNDHLSQMGRTPIENTDRLLGIIKLTHTPEVIKAHQDLVAAEVVGRLEGSK